MTFVNTSLPESEQLGTYAECRCPVGARAKDVLRSVGPQGFAPPDSSRRFHVTVARNFGFGFRNRRCHERRVGDPGSRRGPARNPSDGNGSPRPPPRRRDPPETPEPRWETDRPDANRSPAKS